MRQPPPKKAVSGMSQAAEMIWDALVDKYRKAGMLEESRARQIAGRPGC